MKENNEFGEHNFFEKDRDRETSGGRRCCGEL